MAGSTNMPTLTKNIAPKKSFSELIEFEIRSESVVSAMILPIMKAPNAGLYPTLDAITTIRKHSPTLTISSVSVLMYFLNLRKKSGIIKTPTKNHSSRKKPSFSKLFKSSTPSNFLLTAKALSITISKIPNISSNIRTESTLEAKFCNLSPKSSKAL